MKAKMPVIKGGSMFGRFDHLAGKIIFVSVIGQVEGMEP